MRRRVASGMSVKDVLNMPVSKLSSYTPAEQREIVSRLASAANKRMRTLEKNNINNSALMRLNNSGGKISVKGKSGDDITREFIRARDFLNNKFSKTSYWKKTVKNIKNKSSLSDMPEEQVSNAFSMYDMIRETDAELVNRLNKYELMDYIDGLTMIEGITNPDEIRLRVIEYARAEYERQQRDYNETSTRFSNNIEYDIPQRAQNKRKRKRKR